MIRTANVLILDDERGPLTVAATEVTTAMRSEGRVVEALVLRSDPLPLFSTTEASQYALVEEPTPNSVDTLLARMQSFVDAHGDSTNLVFVQDWMQFKVAIDQPDNRALRSLFHPFNVVVLDWKFGSISGQGLIELPVWRPEAQKILYTTAEDLTKFASVKSDRSLLLAYFRKGFKWRAVAGCISLGIRLSKRSGKIDVMRRALGYRSSPLQRYIHPATTWDSMFDGSPQRFLDTGLADAERAFDESIRQVLQPEELAEFVDVPGYPRSTWSFDNVKALLRGPSTDAEKKAQVCSWLDGPNGLKRRFRLDIHCLLAAACRDGDTIPHCRQFPPESTTFIYTPGIQRLIAVLRIDRVIAQKRGMTGGHEYLITMIQYGRQKDPADARNRLLIGTDEEIRGYFDGSMRPSDLDYIRRLVSSYVPVMFERFNSAATVHPWVGIRLDRGQVICLASQTEEAFQDFRMVGLDRDPEAVNRGAVRFSLLFWDPMSSQLETTDDLEY